MDTAHDLGAGVAIKSARLISTVLAHMPGASAMTSGPQDTLAAGNTTFGAETG
ncbi:MAG: hypothetical protein WD036_09060 [Bauldia sp.]